MKRISQIDIKKEQKWLLEQRKKLTQSRKEMNELIEEDPAEDGIQELIELHKSESNLLTEFANILEHMEAKKIHLKKFDEILKKKPYGPTILDSLKDEKYYLITIINVIDSIRGEINEIVYKHSKGVKLLATTSDWGKHAIDDKSVQKAYGETRKNRLSKKDYCSFKVEELKSPEDFKSFKWEYTSPEYISMVK